MHQRRGFNLPFRAKLPVRQVKFLHVQALGIGQAGPQAPLLQKGEPEKSPRLIGLQSSAKLCRGLQFRAGRLALQLVEQLAEPARTLRTAKGKAVGGILTAKGRRISQAGAAFLLFFFQKSAAARISWLLTSTHCPRTCTRGTLSLARARRFLYATGSLPRETCQSNSAMTSREIDLPPPEKYGIEKLVFLT